MPIPTIQTNANSSVNKSPLLLHRRGGRRGRERRRKNRNKILHRKRIFRNNTGVSERNEPRHWRDKKSLTIKGLTFWDNFVNRISHRVGCVTFLWPKLHCRKVILWLIFGHCCVLNVCKGVCPD